MGSIFSSPKTTESAVGSAVGGAIGSAVIPIPIVGGFIGSSIGKALGGLFGSDKDYPYGRADVYFVDGKAAFGKAEVLDGASQSDFTTLGKVAADSINEIVSLTGSKDFSFTDTKKNYTTVKLGYADARGQLSTGFFAGGGGDFNRGANYEGLKTAEDAIDYSIRDFLQKTNFNDKPELNTTIKTALAEGKNSQQIYEMLLPKTDAKTVSNATPSNYTTIQPTASYEASPVNFGLIGGTILFILLTMKG